ncbi:GSCFA family protein [Planktotalea frisia]|jgi:hypothetical protein|uniref:GSCFA family protein n=1 Tax=Planktotalea frisia TaxID=696762 RepID=A0A1L9P053_9RHOB|nr:GSCFA domain-containing protein [Planktotalea frisia]OJI94898.1 GSCFA family protein [Planktotalea frisia]PZX17976.1 GSCFA family protein [Planktotalea frisia]
MKKKPTKDFAVDEGAKESPSLIYYQMAGKKRRAHGTWYRGESTNFHPMRDSLAEPDAVAKYVGAGWFPKDAFIDKNSYITAFGSCFAQEVTKYLKQNGYRVFGDDLNLEANIIRSGEGIVNSAAMLQQFQWAFELKRFGDDIWHLEDGEEASSSEEARMNIRRIFDKTDVFVFTLGLSEVWYDKEDGEVFWRAVPNRLFDEKRHGFKVMSVEENRSNLIELFKIIRKFRPEATVIFTLSPVPLAATFRPVSCITANSVSKASLRVAIDEVMREFATDANLFYFPSYEIVTSYLDDAMGVDLRHPRPETVDLIMQAFQNAFLIDG